MEIKKVGVVGFGQMGTGIVEVCLRSGYPVVVLDLTRQIMDKGIESIRTAQDRMVKKGRMSEQERDAIMGRLRGTLKMEDFKDCDLVIEAVTENIEEKKKVFTALDKVCPEHTILTSNTSCLSIIAMATVTGRQPKVAGTHFFNPVSLMKLVEVTRTVTSSEETVKTAIAFCESIGKKTIVCKDTPGFLANRLGIHLLIEGMRMLESGVASVEDIDNGAVFGLNHPMGPFQIADLAGIDTVYYICSSLYDEFKDHLYAPPPLLKKMITAGNLGRKSGKGFYDYT